MARRSRRGPSRRKPNGRGACAGSARAVRAGAVAGVRGVGGGVAYVGRSVKLTGVDVATGGGRILGRLFGPFLRAFERAFLRFADRYERTLEWALAHRLEVLSIAVVALAGAVMLAGSLPRGLMPRVDEQQFWVELNLPQGTPIRTTDETAGEVERLLLDMADVSGIFTRVGRSRGSELAARDLTGLNNAALDVQLAGLSRPTSEAIAELRARLAGSGVDPAFVTIETGRATSLGRALAIGEADLAVKVQSGELEELVPVAEAIETRLEGVPALADVRLDFLRTQPELVIEVNREVAARHQITVTSVATAIEDYLRGSETNNAYSVFADKVDIRVTIPETARRELDRVLGLRLQGVPIGELVTVRQGFGPVEIRREDQNRTIQVLADVAEGGLRTAVREVEAAIADIPRPALTTVRVGGENEEMQDSFRSLTFAFALALALVFLIMAAQFESLVQPLVVLTAVPLAAIGAVTALWIAGDGLNAMSGIGFVILIGIVVNDAIVKVDFINQRRRVGLAKRAAIPRSGPAAAPPHRDDDHHDRGRAPPARRRARGRGRPPRPAGRRGDRWPHLRDLPHAHRRAGRIFGPRRALRVRGARPGPAARAPRPVRAPADAGVRPRRRLRTGGSGHGERERGTMIDLAIRRPVATAAIYIALFALGVTSFRLIPVEDLPEVEFPRLTVTATWDGASPEALEAFVTAPLETVIQQVGGVEKVVSESSADQRGTGSSARIEVEFERDTRMEFARLELGERINSIRDELPEGVMPLLSEYVPQEFAEEEEQLLTFSLTGPYTFARLGEIAEEEIAPFVRGLPGVSAVDVRGAERREIAVELDRGRLEALGLRPEEVSRRIVELSEPKAPGSVELDGRQFAIAVRTRALEVSDIADMIVLTRPDGPVRVGDLGAGARPDGRPAVLLAYQLAAHDFNQRVPPVGHERDPGGRRREGRDDRTGLDAAGRAWGSSCCGIRARTSASSSPNFGSAPSPPRS